MRIFLQQQLSKLLLLALFVLSSASWGQVSVTPVNTAPKSSFNTWSYVSVDDAITGSNSYLKLVAASSSVTTPVLNFSNYTAITLDFKAGSFGTVTNAKKTITISISTNNGTNYTVIGTVIPANSTINPQNQISLAGYTGTQVSIKFESLGADGTNGLRLDDIEIKGIEAPASAPVITAANYTGNVGTAFSQTIASTNSPTGFSVTAGTLPAGLSLSNSGVISGTPTAVYTGSVSIKATNGAGDSEAKTFNFTIAKGDQTIIFAALAAKEYGAADFTLGATSTSGLGITYTSETPAVASVNGSTVTIHTIGSTVITATQAGDANYNTATAVTRTLNVTPKTLTLNGLVIASKIYDGTTTATINTLPTLNGIVGSDDVTLNSTNIAATFATPAAATGKTVNVTGLTLSGSAAGNYTLPQTSIVTNGVIEPKGVTVSGATAGTKIYDGTTTATISNGTVVGKVGSDDVTVANIGTFDTANAGTGIPVTVALAGTAAGNYTLTSQPGITGTISKATPVYTAAPISIGVNASYPLSNITSTSNGVRTYVIAPAGLATSDGTNLIAGSTAGTGTVTVNQAEGTNHLEGTTTVNLTVTALAYTTNDYRTTGSGNWSSNSTTGIWERLGSNGNWASSNAPALNTTNSIFIMQGHTITASGFASGVNLKVLGTFNITSSSTAASVVVFDGGTLNVNTGMLGLGNNGIFEVQTNGTVNLNSTSITGTGTFWNGTENFYAGSNFNINNWAYGGGSRLVQSTGSNYANVISANAQGYLFGNLTIAGAPTNTFGLTNLQQPALKLCENNLTFATTSGSVLLTNNSADITVGGDFIINSGTVSGGSTSSPIINVLGNTVLNGGTFTLFQGNGASVTTLELKKNLTVASGATITNASDGSTISFSGNTLQTVNFAGTLNAKVNFEVANNATVKLGQDIALTAATNNVSVLAGGTLNTDVYKFTGAGNFTTVAGATLVTANTGGLNTAISATGTRTFAAGTHYIFDGVTTTPFHAQATHGAPANITTNKDVTLNRTFAPTGNIAVTAGTFDLGTFALNRATPGGSLSIANGATLKLNGGSAAFPTGYSRTFAANSTVEYAGIATVDNLAGTEYTNVALSGTGLKTLANGLLIGNNLTLKSGTANIPAATTVTVKNKVINDAGAANFVVANNGALLQDASATANSNTTAITVKRDSNPLFRQDYSFWASPVAAQQLQAFSPATLSNRFYTYEYNFSGGTYKEAYLPETATNNFAPGKAYLIRMPNVVAGLAGYDDAATAYTFNGSFSGVPNNGSVSVATTLTDLQNGGSLSQAGHYTAVGNPYPSPISVAAFFTQNSGVLDAGTGIYFWRKKNDGNATSYAHLTMLGFTANSATGGDIANGGASFYQNGSGSAFNSDWIISPGQGFLVKFAADPTGPISFTNSMRRAASITGTQPFFRTAGAGTEVSRLWLNLTNANNAAFSQTAIGYLDGATLGLDYGYDARALGEGNAKFYSIAGEDNMAIQARPTFANTDVVPMGFAVTAAGQYSITLDHNDGVFNNGQNVYLKDKLTGMLTNLNEGAYTFTTDAGTFNSRFDVVYTTDAALGTDTPVLANTVVVYQQNGTITINSGSVDMTGVTIYDIRGRVLFNNSKVNGTETTVSNLGIANQVIIVEVQTASGKVSKKIVY